MVIIFIWRPSGPNLARRETVRSTTSHQPTFTDEARAQRSIFSATGRYRYITASENLLSPVPRTDRRGLDIPDRCDVLKLLDKSGLSSVVSASGSFCNRRSARCLREKSARVNRRRSAFTEALLPGLMVIAMLSVTLRPLNKRENRHKHKARFDGK